MELHVKSGFILAYNILLNESRICFLILIFKSVYYVCESIVCIHNTHNSTFYMRYSSCYNHDATFMLQVATFMLQHSCFNIHVEFHAVKTTFKRVRSLSSKVELKSDQLIQSNSSITRGTQFMTQGSDLAIIRVRVDSIVQCVFVTYFSIPSRNAISKRVNF